MPLEPSGFRKVDRGGDPQARRPDAVICPQPGGVSWRVRQVASIARAGIYRSPAAFTWHAALFDPSRLLWLNVEREEPLMSPQHSSIPNHTATAAASTGTMLQALLAAMLGVMLLIGVGFSHIEAVHNAAHDARHSAGFPCHY